MRRIPATITATITTAAILAAPALARAQAEFTVVHAFTPPSGDERGAEPVAIVRASDGKFYGTATSGGTFNQGTVFAIGPDGLVTWLHSFAPGEGRLPNALVQASDGNLYGTTSSNDDGSPGGAAFRIATGGSFSVLHRFAGGAADGSSPSSLIQGIDGNFYGTSAYGGSGVGGTVFRMTADGTVTVLHAFNGTDGGRPHAGLVQASDGTFYGTTTEGGTFGRGTVFKMAADGSLSVLQSVYAHDDFNHPSRMPGLTLATDGNLYGAVPKGSFEPSVFFRVTPAGEFTSLKSVPSNPTSPPVQTLDGRLYGLTVDGTVYAIALDGTVETLTPSGAGSFNFVLGTLISGGDGYLYGTARYWPDPFAGSVFRLEVPMPLMALNQSGPLTVAEPFSFSGWALELGPSPSGGTGIDAVHVWAFPATGASPIFVGAATYGLDRPDVATYFGSGRFTPSGFSVDVSGLANGTYRLDAYAHSTRTGTFVVARSLTIAVPAPYMAIDLPAPGDNQPAFTVSGWAVDTASAVGPGVDWIHVYAYPAGAAPIFLGAASYGASRPDVGAYFGARFTDSGYSLNVSVLAPGSYTLVVFAHSTVTGAVFSQTRSITVRAGSLMMSVDAPLSGTSIAGSLAIAGWAVDAAAPTGTGVDVVHVWAYPADGLSPPFFIGAATYGLARPDVATALGAPRFTNSGYQLDTSLPPGAWLVVVYARSTTSSIFNQSRFFYVFAN